MQAYVRLLIVIAVLTILSGAAYLGSDQEWLRLATPEIRLVGLSANEPLARRLQSDLASRVSPLVGQWVWEVGLDRVFSEVTADRRVKDAQVVRRWPNRVAIEITPHGAPLLFLNRAHRLQPVAFDGSLLPEVALVEAPDVPILRGAEFARRADLRRQAVDLVTSVPESTALRQNLVSEISYESNSGFTLVLGRGGAIVRVGDDDFSQRLLRVSRVLTYLEEQNLGARVIDARFAKKVVVRLRNAP